MTSPDHGEPPPIPAGEDKRLVSARLLTDLVANTLDGGYQAAADRRGGGPSRRWYDRPLVVLGCLLIGFVGVVGYVRTNRGAPAAGRVHDGLVERVRSAQRSGDALAAEIAALQRQLAVLRNQALPAGNGLAAQLRRAQLAAGEFAVRGPGLTVTLSEPPHAAASSSAARGGTVPTTAAHILTDRDVRSVVNELWHDGAEAIAVNGVRLTPTSAVRFAGDAVLVDYQPITSPYRIEALGDTDTLSTAFAQSSVASRYQTRKGVEGLGFSFTDGDSLRLPAGEPVLPRDARAPAPTPSSSRTSR